MASSHKSHERSKLGTRTTLKDGRIKVTVSHGYRLDGNQRRISGIASSEEEADRLALELAAQLGKRPDLGKGLTLRRWWAAYSVTRGSRLVKATFNRYKSDFDNVWLPKLGGCDITLITRKEVQDVLLTLPSRSAASHAKSSLSAVLTQAVRDGHLAENPIRAGGFELPGDVGVMEDSFDWDDPFAAIENSQDVWDARTVLRAMEIIYGTPIETCWLAMVGAGLRREEALALTWRDVRRVEIDGVEVTQIAVYKAMTAADGLKQTKTRRSVRIVAVVEPFGTRLWELRGEPEERVSVYTASNIGRRWANMWVPCPSKHARVKDRVKGIMVDGIEPPIPFVRLNRMRATHETYMQQAGVIDSINAAAHGHSVKVSYAHYQRADDVRAARQAGDFLLVEGGGRRGEGGRKGAANA